MAISRTSEWRKLPLSIKELCIDTTLRCGQSFRWRKINDTWCCSLQGRILSLKQDDDHLHYKVTWPARVDVPLTPPASTRGDGGQPHHEDDTEELLRHYFNLRYSLESLYKKWSKNDVNFRKKAVNFNGVRILNQDAWEALICFICSSNNNISRISQMVSKLCLHYGPPIGHIGGEAFHDFPKPEALIGARVESHLRELGFGYRAKYIAETAKVVATEKPAGWLDSLRNPLSPGWGATGLASSTYKNAHEELLTLAGVGPKVADCVCLMGLGWAEAVPVDTHVWQIAQRDYRFAKTKSKTLNKALYDAVGDHFRKLWGAEAGWAHSVLFTADLRTFSEQASGMPKETSLVEVKEEVQETMHTPQSPSKKRRRRTSSVVADKKDPLVETAIEEPVVVKRSRRGARR